MAKRVTIKDVASAANVSIKTVSNVLNDTGSMRPETRMRVREVMDELGYALNVSARSLKTGNSRLIGLGVLDFTQPFAAYLTDRVIAAARARQYGVIVNTYEISDRGDPLFVEDVFHVGADGWIFAMLPIGQEERMSERSFPVVVAGDSSPRITVDTVTMPHERSVQDTTGRLLDAGCRSVALLGAMPEADDLGYYFGGVEEMQLLRVRGYLKAFAQRGMDIDPSLLIPCARLDNASGVEAAACLLERDSLPDAVVCLNDAMALGALHELQAHGVRVPDDVQVVGFDNVPEGQYSTPGLTTIDPMLDDYARHAVDLLIRRIEGYAGPPRSYCTDYRLIERASTRL